MVDMNLLEIKTKGEIIEKFRLHKDDVGSYPVQIAVLSWEIAHLTEHMKVNKKDLHSLRGLKQKINDRKKFLKKYKEENLDEYNNLVKTLMIRVQKTSEK